MMSWQTQMKLAEAAEISGLHIDTLRRSCRAGELKHRRVSHDHSGILIEHQDLVNYLKRREDICRAPAGALQISLGQCSHRNH